MEVVGKVERGDVVDSELHAEAAGVENEQRPNAPVAKGLAQIAAGARLPHLAARPQFREVAAGRVRGESVVRDSAQKHRDAGNEHRHAPAPPGAGAQADEGREQQRHRHLRGSSAEVAPAGGRRVGGSHYVRSEHHGGVVLRHDEGRADDADGEAEREKRRIVVREADAHHRQRTQNQQAGVGFARADAVAQPADEKASEHRQRHRCDDRVAGLRLGQVQFLPDDRHQRSDAEPAEEAKKERDPGHVERAHGRTGEISQANAGSFVACIHESQFSWIGSK